MPAHIYAIVDGAREDRIYPALVKSEGEYCCLYRGELDPDLAAAAPYLVKVQQDAPFTNWLITHGWGESWGVFLKSGVGLNELRRHFRRFLMVYDHTGKPLYFRYYDPRVLRTYLPTCNPSDLATLFGPVNRYYVEGEDRNSLIEYGVREAKLTQRTHRLAAAAGARA
jgi:hypothetical protein